MTEPQEGCISKNSAIIPLMSNKRTPLFTIAQIRRCETLAVLHNNVTESELMIRAGEAAFLILTQSYPNARKLLVYCGQGNNAGDGYVLARLAHQAGFDLKVYYTKSMDTLPPSAASEAFNAKQAGVSCVPIHEATEFAADVIIDALLGIGIVGQVKEALVPIFHQINDSGLPVLSLDVPSGLNADTGTMMGSCIKAHTTVTFIGQKLGMHTLNALDYCGRIICQDLQLSSLLAEQTPAAYLLAKDEDTSLPRRPRHCHKNNFGHVLVIGGNKGMPGAVYLAAKAALTMGAGVVSIGMHPCYATGSLFNLPEVMVHGVGEPEILASLLSKASVCVIGPGLGSDDWAYRLFMAAMDSQLPMIVDASALHLLANNPRQNAHWVLSPHPGEAASLLHCSVGQIQEDRLKAVQSLQSTYGGTIVLKGAGTLIYTHTSDTFICEAGNPGMATAGMGDVLSGIIAALRAQGIPLDKAASQGVLIHAQAADMAVEEKGEHGLMASDLMPYLRYLINKKVVSDAK